MKLLDLRFNADDIIEMRPCFSKKKIRQLIDGRTEDGTFTMRELLTSYNDQDPEDFHNSDNALWAFDMLALFRPEFAEFVQCMLEPEDDTVGSCMISITGDYHGPNCGMECDLALSLLEQWDYYPEFSGRSMSSLAGIINNATLTPRTRALALLEHTARFYNSSNRAISEMGRCVYEPTETSPGCAIGKWCPELHGLEGEIAVVWRHVRRSWKGKMLTWRWLRPSQWLHDGKDYWTDTGLSTRGIKDYHSAAAKINALYK